MQANNESFYTIKSLFNYLNYGHISFFFRGGSVTHKLKKRLWTS